MYEYDLITTDSNSLNTYIDMFTNYWGDYPYYEVTRFIPKQYEQGALEHFCAAIEISTQEIVGVIGILNITDGSEAEYPGDDWYKFAHLVVADAHRHQGLGVGLIRMAVKFLIEKRGACGIINYKKTNVLSHSIFTDMGFEEVYFDPDEIEYKWKYELDVAGADMTTLNDIWSIYNERT